MPPHAHSRLQSAIIATQLAIGGSLVAGCGGGSGDRADAAAGWTAREVNAVSRSATGGGVTAVTGLRADGTLETAVYDLAGGRRLWARPATMPGRLSGMGVQPPAVAGPPGGQPVVAAVEPRQSGRQRGRLTAALVARDARTGKERWSRPVDSSFGPVGCGGGQICLSEFTARRNARFVALDAATGRALWRAAGIAEVEHADPRRTVLFRMSKHPTLESRDPRTGRTQWAFPVERAVGGGVNLSGGWSFGVVGDVVVGYLAPYQARKGARMSAFGFFALRAADGRPLWARRNLLRVYPSASPAVALITRELTKGGYGGFAQLDPHTGRPTAQIPAARAPKSAWWLSFPADLSALGFLTGGRPGSAYRLRGAGPAAPAPAQVKGLRTWSFCTVNPAELRIAGHRGFFPIAPLCAYDLGTGRRIAAPGAPPGWYTGAVDGWRVWRDERGALHAVKDAKGTAPGMYGS